MMNLNLRRFYYLPLSTGKAHPSARADEAFGGRLSQSRSAESFERALSRAVSGGYQAVIFPANALFLDQINDSITRARQYGLEVILEINSLSLHGNWGRIRRLVSETGLWIHYVVESFERRDVELLAQLEGMTPFLYFTFLVHKKTPLMRWVSQFPEHWHPRAHLFFPYALEAGDGYLTTQEVATLVRQVRARHPKFPVQGPLGVDIYDPRIREDMDLEPVIEPEWVWNCSTRPLVSVVIPTFENRDYLLNTVRHLFQQDLGHASFEVIVVDDGSTDGTGSALREHLASFEGKANLKYIYFPRPRPRRMGDHQFRAGVARNLGVKWASGQLLSFLDSDILTPPEFLRHLLKKHETYDVVQCQRPHLKKTISSIGTDYADIHPNRDCFVPEGGYWEDFYAEEREKGWANIEHSWKYVCTHTLSLPTDLFKKMGWFRKNYIFYGFEDTDLGYRLVREGHSLHLSECQVYHLYHRTQRSEFQNSAVLRHSLLRNTARIFYHHWLDPEIFTLFNGMLRDDFTLRTAFRKLSSRFRSLHLTPE